MESRNIDKFSSKGNYSNDYYMPDIYLQKKISNTKKALNFQNYPKRVKQFLFIMGRKTKYIIFYNCCVL